MSKPDQSNWRREAFAEYAERRAAKKAEAELARQNADKYAAIAKQRDAELIELDRAAKVLGIVAEPEEEFQWLNPDQVPERAGNADVPGFKALAVDCLKEAYPGSVRAAQVQAYAERKTLRKFHEKTAGMTLFRLSKDGVARRDGWDWFFIPENQRSAAQTDPGEGGAMD